MNQVTVPMPIFCALQAFSDINVGLSLALTAGPKNGAVEVLDMTNRICRDLYLATMKAQEECDKEVIIACEWAISKLCEIGAMFETANPEKEDDAKAIVGHASALSKTIGELAESWKAKYGQPQEPDVVSAQEADKE